MEVDADSAIVDGNAELYLVVRDSPSTPAQNEFGLVLDGGTLYAYTITNGVPANNATVPWNAATMKYWWVETLGGIASVRYSADDVTWTTLYRMSTPTWMRQVTPALGFDAWAAVASSYSVTLDNVVIG